MSGGHRERGSVAVGAALVVLLGGGILAAAVAEIARTELVLARSRRTFASGLAAADACLARVTARLPAGWDHAAAIVGADGVPGTADDGILAAPSGCTARLLAGPLGPARPFLDVAADVATGGRRLRAVVAPAPSPVPALVWAADGTELGTVTGRLALDGGDAARPDLRPLAAVATPDDPGLVDAWLAARPGVTLAGATAPPEYAPAPPLAGVATRLIAAGAPRTFAPAPIATPAALHAIGGDLAITGPGQGAGILYVDGRLDIEADFAFNGVVAARGGVRVASGVTVRVAGAIWIGPPAFDVAGELTVTHDRAALDVAAALHPFPRRAAVDGLIDR